MQRQSVWRARPAGFGLRHAKGMKKSGKKQVGLDYLGALTLSTMWFAFFLLMGCTTRFECAPLMYVYKHQSINLYINNHN